MTLLRMTTLSTTSITSPSRVLIDNQDISTLSPNQVRQACFAVIPQEPYFIPGTFRWSLDPEGRLVAGKDEQIETALSKVGLWDKVRAKDGGLGAQLVMAEWSTGERQLLSLARALLSRCRIVLVDEVMSR